MTQRFARAQGRFVTRARPRYVQSPSATLGTFPADTLRDNRRELPDGKCGLFATGNVRRYGALAPFTDRFRLSAYRRPPFWLIAGATTGRPRSSRRTHFPIPIFLLCRRSFIRQKRIITGARGYLEPLDGEVPAPSTGSTRIDFCPLSVVRCPLSDGTCYTRRSAN